MTGSRAEADDLVQEAAARALERADQVVEADPTGWLLAMTTRLCLDHLRRLAVVIPQFRVNTRIVKARLVGARPRARFPLAYKGRTTSPREIRAMTEASTATYMRSSWVLMQPRTIEEALRVRAIVRG
jgi:hypothetical protein